MECKRIIEATFQSLDNEMDPETHADFEAHLERCPPCSERSRIVISYLLMFRRSDACRCAAPRDLHERVRELLRRHCSGPPSTSQSS